jgi:uncharacterized protein YndB with AHSA1/START domain
MTDTDTDTATETAAEKASARELVLERTLDASRAAVWRCWTEPALMERWFCPVPWKATDITVDLRPGGQVSMTMRGPGGEAFPNDGVYLEVEPGRRLVFTDAYRAGWQPADQEHDLPLVRQGRRGGRPLLRRDLSRQRGHAVHRAPSDYPSGKAGDVLTVEFTVAASPASASTAGPRSRTARPSRSRSPPTTRRRPTATGTPSSATAARRARAAGARTGGASPGRSRRAC